MVDNSVYKQDYNKYPLITIIIIYVRTQFVTAPEQYWDHTLRAQTI